MKKGLLIIVSILLIVLVGAGLYLNPLLPIITGYAAKGLASGVFVSGREQEDIEKVDLNFSFIKYTKNKVNMEDKSVTSRFLWHKSEAVYQEGYGCTIVRDYAKEDILNRPSLSFSSTTALNPELDWPAGDNVTSYRPKNVDYTVLREAVNHAFGTLPPYNGTRALIVIHDDQMETGCSTNWGILGPMPRINRPLQHRIRFGTILPYRQILYA